MAFSAVSVVVVSMILATGLAQAVTSVPTGSCLFNSTHCSCRNVEQPGTCLRQIGGGQCEAAKCSASGFTCDCTGTSICRMASCKAWVSSDGTPTSTLGLGTTLGCRLGTVEGCLTKVGEEEVPAPEPEPTEYRMVQFGKGAPNTMFNMTAFIDEGGVIAANSANMHGKWKNAQRLRRRFITMRMYDSETPGPRMLCAIYNTYGVKDDKLGNMKVRTKIYGTSNQRLEWAACDDKGECVGQSGLELAANHGLVSFLSDGWCVKPLESNGNVVTVRFSEVVGMKGVVLQSTAGQDQVFLFSDGKKNGMSGRVDKHGLVNHGEVPDIQFNLRGIEVPF